jgi:iron(III) transport system permease protein
VVFLLAAKHYVAIKDYSSLAYSRVERRRLSAPVQALVVAALSLVMLLSFLPYLGVGLAAFGRGWSLTPLPTSYTVQFFERVLVETPKYVLNSLLYSGLAVAICVAVGVPIAWLLARTRLPGNELLDALNTLILAIPGTAIGIAYVRAFHYDVPGLGLPLTSVWRSCRWSSRSGGSRTRCAGATPRSSSSTARSRRRPEASAPRACGRSPT